MRNIGLAITFALSIPLVACTGNISDGSGGAGDDDGVDSTGDGGPDEFGPDAQVCDQSTPINATQEQKVPDMLLVLDKSGSMGDPLNGGNSKMNVMKQALSTVLPAHDATIHWGLEYYPADAVCGAGTVVSGIAPMNAANVVAQVNALQPEGATPSHTSLTAALGYYATIPVNPDGRFVLLATDGLPNCNGDPNNPSNPQTIAAAAALAAAGIKVYVIGFGDVAVSDPNFLNQVAAAGGTGNYYAANSPADLQMALDAIAGTVVTASCTYQLQAVPEDPTKLTVTLDGNVIPRDPSHGTGWDYDPNTNSITFYGDTCGGIQSGAAGAIQIDYGCEGGPVIGKPER